MKLPSKDFLWLAGVIQYSLGKENGRKVYLVLEAQLDFS